MEAALALHGLVDHAGEESGSTWLLNSASTDCQRLGGADAAVRVRRLRAVDLRRERAEALLVRHHLGGQAHAHQRAAVEGVLEAHDRRATGVVAGDLDGVLGRLGAGVDQQRLVRPGARVAGDEAPADLEERLVLRDRVALVQVLRGLLLDRRDDALRRVAAVQDADAADEVDVLAPFDVGQARAVRVLHEDRGRRDTARHQALALGLQLRGPGADSLVNRHGDLLAPRPRRVSMTSRSYRFARAEYAHMDRRACRWTETAAKPVQHG